MSVSKSCDKGRILNRHRMLYFGTKDKNGNSKEKERPYFKTGIIISILSSGLLCCRVRLSDQRGVQKKRKKKITIVLFCL